MRRFITGRNIERYRRMLTTEIADARRQAIMKLLAEEEDTWDRLSGVDDSDKPNGT